MELVSAIRGITIGSEAVVQIEGFDEPPSFLLVNGVAARIAFQGDPEVPGRWRGKVGGLTFGENLICSDGADADPLKFRSFPVEGPILSGPHLQPWTLTTEQNGLGAPSDTHGNAQPKVTYHYMAADSGGFLAYDPANPPNPSQVMQTTTDEGVALPYIVHHEIGSMARGIYEFAVLCDPERLRSLTARHHGWNGKLWIYMYGGWNQLWSQSAFPPPAPPEGPGINHTVLIDAGLRRGIMIARTTFTQSVTNSDTIRGAESLIMLKDHITRNFGDIRYTFGSGASGGSIMQHMIANQYPGIFQGIMPLVSLHSSWYVPGVLADSNLLENYFTHTAPELWQNEDDRLAVDGHRSETTRKFFATVFDGTFLDGRPTGGNTPTRGTGLPPEAAYDPESNPGGARGTLQDYQVNYLGRRAEALWTAAERAAGQGFAPLVWDNVGVQYGLQALLNGRISPEQFVDLNEKIGGVDIDNNFVPARTEADPVSLERLHRGGFINDFSNMSEVAILDVRQPEETDLPSHTGFHTWVAREFLTVAQGHAGNQVAWMVPGWESWTTPPETALLAMDRWLAGIEADHSDAPLADKVVANKPADVLDGVYAPDGIRTGDLEAFKRDYPSFGDARTVAACGAYVVHRIAKTQLKPLNRGDYSGIAFSDNQWARLEAAFPTGVADWSKPGVGQTKSIAWLDYTSGPGGVPLPVK
ncbi:MAG: DUF6351 family protein [Novosphingobium sp.]